MSDFTPYVLFVLGAGLGGVSWWAKSLRKDLDSAKEDITTLKIEYVRYDRLKDIMQPVMDALQEIKETLKTKADR